MKPYFIYFTENGQPCIESGFFAYIPKAKNEIDALRQIYIHCNAYYNNNSYFCNCTYTSVCALS